MLQEDMNIQHCEVMFTILFCVNTICTTCDGWFLRINSDVSKFVSANYSAYIIVAFSYINYIIC